MSHATLDATSVPELRSAGMRIRSIEAIPVEIARARDFGGPTIKDGMVPVTQDPGFGLIVDEAVVRRYRVD
jgi:hypothetical protein